MKNFLLLLAFINLQYASFSQVPLAPIKVHITDFNSKNLNGEQVLFVNQLTKKIVKGTSNTNGIFNIKLEAGKYNIKLKSIGDAQNYSTIEIPKINDNQFYNEMSIEIKISLPKFFTLNNLHFSVGSNKILKSSYKELNELVEYMSLKNDIKIEIGGHTDSDGDFEKNMDLSLARAIAVKKYLILKGINANRIITKGYGETKPIATNSTNEGKAKNRRTEVKII